MLKFFLKRNKILLIFFLGSISCGFVGSFFFWQGIYWPRFTNSDEEIIFTIEEGENLFSIAQNLEESGLIKDKIFFQLYVFLKGEWRNLKAGDYQLNSSISPAEIADKIIKGETVKNNITVPEGFTIEQIEDLFNSKIELASQKPETYKKEFGFLEGVPDIASLEGFLFPDTYYFKPEMTEKEVARVFLKNFDKQLNPQLRNEIKAQAKTIFDIVRMASLLEKEVKTIGEKKIASGILWKRLENGIPLQVDATITYLTNKKTTKISKEETQIDSLYNTYKYKGLPIGPICNPGLESLLAAIQPEENPYWYYLSTPKGEIIFSQTLEEHNLAKAKYLK